MPQIKMSLACARVNRGLTQKEAAKMLGVSNKTLCKWENYLAYPNVKYVDAICKLYGLCYDQIVFLP